MNLELNVIKCYILLYFVKKIVVGIGYVVVDGLGMKDELVGSSI